MQNLIKLFAMLCLAMVSLGFTASTAVAQDMTVDAEWADDTITDRPITFTDGGDSGVTTGEVVCDGWYGWTWERVDHSFKIYDDAGKHVMTVVGAANENNTTGAITDGDGTTVDWGGTWSR